MRRALLAILLLALTAWAPASTAWAATSPQTIRAILRDCEDDGALSGSYRPAELRDAVRNIGTDLDQYSDCRDVLSAAVLRAVSRRNAPTDGGGDAAPTDGSGAASGSAGSAGGSAGTGAGSAGTGAGTAGDAGGDTGPRNAEFGAPGTLAPQDRGEIVALEEADRNAPAPTLVGGRSIDLASPRGVAAVMAHDLPAPVLVALAALALGALAAGIPALHRRVRARRPA